jgi:hypothetical protein
VRARYYRARRILNRSRDCAFIRLSKRLMRRQEKEAETNESKAAEASQPICDVAFMAHAIVLHFLFHRSFSRYPRFALLPPIVRLKM